MASENVSGRMVELIKEIMLAEKRKVMECILFLMENNLKEIGYLEISMDTVN
jgi:hypothetical protein